MEELSEIERLRRELSFKQETINEWNAAGERLNRANFLLTEQLKVITAERDRWMEDSQRQTKTIQRLADAVEDRNKVDVNREAFHAEQLAAMTMERHDLANRVMVAEHKLAAMTAERDSFRQSLADMYDERTARLEEAQAREQQLRKAIRELITTFGKVRDE
jgi:hypothetical protein